MKKSEVWMGAVKVARLREVMAAVALVVVAIIVLFVLVAVVLPIPEEAIPRGSQNYGFLRVEQVTLSGTGTAGAVSDSRTTDGPIHGHLYAVNLDYTGGISTTTDVTISLASPALTVLQLSDYYTDTWIYPAVQQADSAGSGTSTYDRMPAAGYLTIAAGQTSSGTIATVTVWWGE
jgi:hypothetical protein